MRVLIIKLSSMGDIVHTFPAVTDLLSNYPDAEIDWMVDSSFETITELYPKLRKVYSFPLRKFKKNKSLETFRELKAILKEIRQNKYDYIIDPQGLPKTGVWMPFIKGLSCGFHKDTIKDQWAPIFYKKKIRLPKDMLVIQKIRHLFAKSIGYSIEDNQFDYGLDELKNPSDKFALFLHGTTRTIKECPLEHWSFMADIFHSHGLKVYVPWSNPAEFERANFLCEKHTNVHILPKVNLKNMIEFVRQSSFVIGVDTGLAHIAAAYNIPTIGLYNYLSDLAPVTGKKVKNIFSDIHCQKKCKKNYCQITDSKTPECMRKLDLNQIKLTIEDFLLQYKTIQK